jgi:hypothetical protein
VWTSFDERGTHRVYIARLGPFSAAILLLMMTAVCTENSNSHVMVMKPSKDSV